jgi:UDPglucose 6-dehydrogenase
LADQYGYRLKTVEAAVDVNAEQRIKLFSKAARRLITFNGLKIAVLGLTFKPNTDDLREAASLYNIPLLLEAGAEIIAYDPVGMENFKKMYPEGKIQKGSIKYVNNAEDTLKGANVCFIFTEWPQIMEIKPEQYSSLMRTALIFDGRNIYSPEEMRASGVEYHSIGR